MSEDENRLIKEKREAWIPSKKAIDLYKLLNSWKDRNALFQLENSNIYYDSPDDHPEPFIAQIRDVIVESVLDSDIAFDQLFIFLSNPRHLNGESIFKEINYDYLTLLELQGNGDYKINFNAVTKFSVEQVSFWKKLFTKKNGR